MKIRLSIGSQYLQWSEQRVMIWRRHRPSPTWRQKWVSKFVCRKSKRTKDTIVLASRHVSHPVWGWICTRIRGFCTLVTLVSTVSIRVCPSWSRVGEVGGWCRRCRRYGRWYTSPPLSQSNRYVLRFVFPTNLPSSSKTYRELSGSCLKHGHDPHLSKEFYGLSLESPRPCVRKVKRDPVPDVKTTRRDGKGVPPFDRDPI